MDDIKRESMYDELLLCGVSEDTIAMVESINGVNEETYHDMLYVVCGMRTFEFEEDEEFDEIMEDED